MFASKALSKSLNLFVREYSRSPLKEAKEYTVTPKCKLNVVLAFNTVMKTFIPEVDLECNNKVKINCDKLLQCNQIGDTINVSSGNHKPEKNVTCFIQAPAKCSFNVTCAGDIQVTGFQGGQTVRLFSENGNVSIQNSNIDSIWAKANKGNIATLGTVECEKVEFITRKLGKILANRIKCIDLVAQTEEGEIAATSCSSEQSYFVTKSGYINLDHVQNNCKVRVENEGYVNMIGFDGVLEFNLHNGIADLQIYDIKSQSYIEIRDEGKLTLRLGDNVLNNTQVRINSNECNVQEDIAHEGGKNDLICITPKLNKNYNVLRVTCPKSLVNVKSASWTDKIRKRSRVNVVEEFN